MKSHGLKHMHFGTGAASHDNTMWKHIVEEFGGDSGKDLIVENQTHCLYAFQFMRSTEADGSYADLCCLMKDNCDHRKFQAVSVVAFKRL